MSEKKIEAVQSGVPSVDARVSRATRVYEGSDYDALLRRYKELLTPGEGKQRDEFPALIVRAELDVEIAKDQSANILALRNLTEKGAAEANALSRRVYWLNWILVGIGVAAIGAAWWFWAHPNP